MAQFEKSENNQGYRGESSDSLWLESHLPIDGTFRWQPSVIARNEMTWQPLRLLRSARNDILSLPVTEALPHRHLFP